MAYTMPGHTELSSPLERQLLMQLGERIRRTRTTQKVTVVDLAKRLGMSRSTVYAAEAGDASVTVGTYVRILGALGIAGDLALVGASPGTTGLAAHGRGVEALVELMLHREAIRALQVDPRLRSRIREIVQSWAPPRALAWTRMVDDSDWGPVLADTPGAAAMRLHSPLPAVLPPALRAAISTVVRGSGARTPEQLDLAELQRAKAYAAIEELRSVGVVAELFGSLVHGRWDARRSDVDVLILERGNATESAIEDVLKLFVGPKVDILYVDTLRGPSREYLLKMFREHGRPDVQLHYGVPVT